MNIWKSNAPKLIIMLWVWFENWEVVGGCGGGFEGVKKNNKVKRKRKELNWIEFRQAKGKELFIFYVKENSKKKKRKNIKVKWGLGQSFYISIIMIYNFTGDAEGRDLHPRFIIIAPIFHISF